jgi:hypothetical protein
MSGASDVVKGRLLHTMLLFRFGFAMGCQKSRINEIQGFVNQKKARGTWNRMEIRVLQLKIFFNMIPIPLQHLIRCR